MQQQGKIGLDTLHNRVQFQPSANDPPFLRRRSSSSSALLSGLTDRNEISPEEQQQLALLRQIRIQQQLMQQAQRQQQLQQQQQQQQQRQQPGDAGRDGYSSTNASCLAPPIPQHNQRPSSSDSSTSPEARSLSPIKRPRSSSSATSHPVSDGPLHPHALANLRRRNGTISNNGSTASLFSDGSFIHDHIVATESSPFSSASTRNTGMSNASSSPFHGTPEPMPINHHFTPSFRPADLSASPLRPLARNPRPAPSGHDFFQRSKETSNSSSAVNLFSGRSSPMMPPTNTGSHSRQPSRSPQPRRGRGPPLEQFGRGETTQLIAHGDAHVLSDAEGPFCFPRSNPSFPDRSVSAHRASSPRRSRAPPPSLTVSTAGRGNVSYSACKGGGRYAQFSPMDGSANATTSTNPSPLRTPAMLRRARSSQALLPVPSKDLVGPLFAAAVDPPRDRPSSASSLQRRHGHLGGDSDCLVDDQTGSTSASDARIESAQALLARPSTADANIFKFPAIPESPSSTCSPRSAQNESFPSPQQDQQQQRPSSKGGKRRSSIPTHMFDFPSNHSSRASSTASLNLDCLQTTPGDDASDGEEGTPLRKKRPSAIECASVERDELEAGANETNYTGEGSDSNLPRVGGLPDTDNQDAPSSQTLASMGSSASLVERLKQPLQDFDAGTISNQQAANPADIARLDALQQSILALYRQKQQQQLEEEQQRQQDMEQKKQSKARQKRNRTSFSKKGRGPVPAPINTGSGVSHRGSKASPRTPTRKSLPTPITPGTEMALSMEAKLKLDDGSCTSLHQKSASNRNSMSHPALLLHGLEPQFSSFDGDKTPTLPSSPRDSIGTIGEGFRQHSRTGSFFFEMNNNSDGHHRNGEEKGDETEATGVNDVRFGGRGCKETAPHAECDVPNPLQSTEFATATQMMNTPLDRSQRRTSDGAGRSSCSETSTIFPSVATLLDGNLGGIDTQGDGEVPALADQPRALAEKWSQGMGDTRLPGDTSVLPFESEGTSEGGLAPLPFMPGFSDPVGQSEQPSADEDSTAFYGDGHEDLFNGLGMRADSMDISDLALCADDSFLLE